MLKLHTQTWRQWHKNITITDHCGKHRHIKQDYFELPKGSVKRENGKFKKKPTKQRVSAVTKDEDKSGKETIGLVLGHALTRSDTLSNWTVDSGATCLVCNGKDLFIDITQLKEAQKITVGDGFSVEAIGRGTVELFINILNNEVQHCQLFDILYVPQMFYNLLSVSKATKLGKTFESVQMSCNILDKRKRAVTTATKSGNFYHLNCI